MQTLYMVKSNPLAEHEDAFNDWYNTIHLPEVLKIGGFISAKRFKLAPTQMFERQTHEYLAIYEIDTNDVEATLKNLREASWLNMGESIDLATIDISIFQSID
jgi:hypothetical protein